MMGYGAGLGFGFGGLLTLLGCALLVVGVVVLIAWALGRNGQGTQVAPAHAPGLAADDAVEVLRARFARGEMTADEFVAAKLILEARRWTSAWARRDLPRSAAGGLTRVSRRRPQSVAGACRRVDT